MFLQVMPTQPPPPPASSSAPTTQHPCPNVVRSVLAALAFESTSLHFSLTRKQRNSLTSESSPSLAATDPPSVDSLSEGDAGGLIHSHSLVHGTIDATGDTIEVYFDAAEEHLPCHYEDLLYGLPTTNGFDNPATNNNSNAATDAGDVHLNTNNNIQHHHQSMLPMEFRCGALPDPRQYMAGSDLGSLHTASTRYFTPRQSLGPDDQWNDGSIPPPPDHLQQQLHVSCYNPDYLFPPPPPPPKELPLRFLRAGKGDAVEGQRRYDATLQWRKELGMDTILQQPNPNFELIKQYYPHYFHFKGRNGEPVFYELPPKTNLKALRNGGVTVPMLLRHYAMVTEFGWQYLEQDDFARSIYIIDLDGIKLTDFVGECVDFVRKASEFTGAHYPERAGVVMIINVPSWFKLIWNVVKAWIDEVTLQKIYILRGQDEIRKAMSERIPIEYIPKEYGGTCTVPLGQSPEEECMWNLMRHNNLRAQAMMTPHSGNGGHRICNGYHDPNCANNPVPQQATPPCPYCSFCPVRSY